jgi:hypothetical protein
LQPYLKSKQIFVCPSASGTVVDPNDTAGYPTDGKDHSWRINAPSGSGDYTASYGMNNQLEGTSLSENRLPTLKSMFFDAGLPQAGSAFAPE